MSILNELNEEQRAAASAIEGPVLILAGAGSGKTRTITYRIAHMVLEKGISAGSILAVTFTNKAAKEMKERVMKITGDEGSRIMVSTFHSFGVRMLRSYGDRIGLASNFNIYDAGDQKQIVAKIMKEMRMEAKEAGRVHGKLSKLKEEGMLPEEYEQFAYSPQEKSFNEIYRKYQDELKKNNGLDFTDILIFTEKLLKNEEVLLKLQDKFKYIMIDEYQDTNKVQYNIVKKLAEKHRNICVVGDEDQSIYRFRGADIKNILDFEKDYREAKVVKLERNYRSTEIIVESASQIIHNNMSSKKKKLWTDKKNGEKIRVYEAYDASNEAKFISDEIRKLRIGDRDYRDFTILYRTNAQSRVFEDEMRRQSIPYKLHGSIEFYQRKEIKDLIAYLNVVNNQSDSLSLSRVINVPARGIGDTTLERVERYRNNLNVSLFYALQNAESIEEITVPVKIKLKGVYDIFAELIAMTEYATASEIAEKVLEITKYIEKIPEMERDERAANIIELINSIKEKEEETGYLSLSEYLEQVSLVSGSDNIEENENAVKLMTVHSSKGLEFPVVFIAGMEEELFPNSKSNLDTEELEEERRLCYVAITRAEEILYMTYSKQRVSYGTSSFFRQKSRFIEELPFKNVQIVLGKQPTEEFQTKYFSTGEKDVYAGNSSYLFVKKEIVKDDDFKIGEFINHKSFGKGKIAEIERLKDKKDEADKFRVIFENAGEKSFRRSVLEKFIVN